MSARHYAFLIFLIMTCGYALWRGHNDERIVALTCLLATIATHVAVPPIDLRYSPIEPELVAIDIAVLGAFLWVALTSQRFWPLWVAGLQLVNSIAHSIRLADIDLLPRSYAAAASLWSYPILAILAIGTWRGRHHMLAEPIRAAT